MHSALPRLIIITDRKAAAPRSLGDVIASALDALPPGGAIVQLREKDLGGAELLALALEIREIAAARDCPVLVNDRLDVALAAGCAGVHLPETGLAIATARAVAGERKLLIGTSTHCAAAAASRADDGADLVIIGPIWPTPSKARYGPPLGAEAVSRAATAIGGAAPLYAIGGIDGPEQARRALASGAHGVAVIRAVIAARDPGAAARALHRALH